MRPIFAMAKNALKKRVAFAEGEDERVLRAAQVIVDEGLARPILIGRPNVLDRRIEKFGLRIKAGKDFDLINLESDPRYRDYWQEYHRLTERRGVSEQYAKIEMRRRATLIGSMMIHRGEADGMICGTFGTHALHLHYVDQVIGRRTGVDNYYAMNVLMLPQQTVFICDTYVNLDPTAEQITEMTLLAVEEIRRFGIVPKAALSESVRLAAFPHSRLKGQANLLIMPTLDAANIAFNLLKTAAGDGITIGPILLGAAKPVHIITPTATVRRIVNMTALTVVDANAQRGQQSALL